MDEAPRSRTSFFSRIRHQEDAVKIVRAASLVFLAVGAFLAILSYWSGFELWVHGLAYMVLAVLLRQFKSRVIASLLVLVAVVMLLLELKLFSGQAYSAALNIIIAAIAVWVGARAVEATIKLRARQSNAPTGDA